MSLVREFGTSAGKTQTQRIPVSNIAAARLPEIVPTCFNVDRGPAFSSTIVVDSNQYLSSANLTQIPASSRRSKEADEQTLCDSIRRSRFTSKPYTPLFIQKPSNSSELNSEFRPKSPCRCWAELRDVRISTGDVNKQAKDAGQLTQMVSGLPKIRLVHPEWMLHFAQ